MGTRHGSLARRYLAHNGFCVVASSAFGHHIPALLRASLKPKYIFDALSDNELMLAAVTVGGHRQRGRLTFFGHSPNGWHAGSLIGVCHSDDALAIWNGHHPFDLTTGRLLTGWDIA